MGLMRPIIPTFFRLVRLMYSLVPTSREELVDFAKHIPPFDQVHALH